MSKLFVIFIFLLVFLFYFSNNVFAQGTISCKRFNAQTHAIQPCETTMISCSTGFQSPITPKEETCQTYADLSITATNPSGICPNSIPCVPIPPKSDCGGQNQACCNTSKNPLPYCNPGFVTSDRVDVTKCTCVPPPPTGCQGPNCTSAKGKECKNGKAGVQTAIGCIPTEPTAFIQSFIKVAIAAGGGIALLLMIYGAFQMITSAGNPDGVKKGHEQITSAVIGLLFIIFAVMLLKVIGVDILQIPGFSP